MAVEYGDRYSVEQEILKEQATKARNAISDAVGLAGTKGAGMMYHAVGEGQRQGAGLEGLGRMLTGQEKPIDPRLARQDALAAILDPHGTPDSYEDMVAIANDLRAGGFPGEADLAMKQANDYQKTLTDALKAQTSSTKAPTREDSDYLKIVNGKEVIYTKTEEWQSSTQTWKLVSEAPKYGPDKPTATIQDLLFHAALVQNQDGSVGCDLDKDDCFIKATDLYHTAAVKETALDKELGEFAGKDITEKYSAAEKGVGTIHTIDTAFNALNSGEAITGWAAQPRLTLAKAIGFFKGTDKENIAATEVWMAVTGKLVAEIMGSGDLGAGTGLSDNDIKFAKAMVGGDIGLDETSVRRILWMRRILESEKIKRWNAQYSEMPERLKNQLAGWGYSESTMVQTIPDWSEDQVYIRHPDGHKVQTNTQGEKRYLWPATEFDLDFITINEVKYTIHDKNGFDITPTE